MSATIERKGDDIIMRFSGVLDEVFEFPEVAERPKGRLILELAGVTVINSIACRNWVNWIKELPGIELQECSPAIVNQANILIGFIPPTAKIKSFYVPYFCEPCEHEERILLTEGKGFQPGGPIELPSDLKCPKCGEPMVLDVIPERYFLFLKK